jgi:S-DNA-T family DNA segregation ATPase FtsK/SpoIIIE
LPPLDFLQHPDLTNKPTVSKDEVMANARLIQTTLALDEIEVSLGDIHVGPTITNYKLHLAPGVMVEQILERSSQLADALNVESVRIIRLKDEFMTVEGNQIVLCFVSVEVPNHVRTKVIMRDLFESDEWRNAEVKIPIAFGKDAYGHPIIADLADMPHLFIGGSVGSGKSICIHSIILSLLYRFSPDQLRFVMIDSKGIELQPYNALPHLVAPVISDPQKAILALRWVVNEMEKRFQLFMRVGVTHIGSFNARPKAGIVGANENDIVIPEKLSYVVVIIENLEDLTQAAKADVEVALEHITQNGRVAGVHLLLATRQTNQNVISEPVKTEIPSRIAFRCASRIESRSIIGEAGAEKLSGKGDMLCLLPGSGKLIRAQGALISDQEINCIIEFIAKQAKPGYEVEIHRQLSKPTANYGNENGIDEDEEIIQQCIEVIRSEQKASVSLLQRRLRLGYTRAALIMDELENRGIVGPSKGAEPRDILIDLDAGDYTTSIKQPPIIQPHLIVCVCEHCSEKIEFDANELGDRQSVTVSCPHCGVETSLSNPR